MFKNAAISGHKGWGKKPNYLPEWEVPGHDCQYHAYRLKGYITSASICAYKLIL